MKKTLYGYLPLFFALFIAPSVFASSNLETSANNNFSYITLDFNAGQTVYVRLNTDSAGDKIHILNLRDNQYNQINAYNLSKNGNLFTASFTAPNSEGYYSLEAKIESDGSQITSVKTIKVGNPNNADVNVQIHNNISGQKVLGSDTSQSEPIAKETDNNNVAYQSSSAPKSDLAGNGDVEFPQKPPEVQSDNNIFHKAKIIIIKIASIIWPF